MTRIAIDRVAGRSLANPGFTGLVHTAPNYTREGCGRELAQREPVIFGARRVELDSSERRHDWETLSDRSLVDALRARMPEAVDEFVRRFERAAARYARASEIEAGERAHWAGELLYEVAMTLRRSRGAPPRHLGAYVAGACRLRVQEMRAREAMYRTRIDDALADVHDDRLRLREVVVASLCSEYSLRDARGPDWEEPPLAPVLERLVTAIDEGISPDERRLLKWLGDQISYTTIAEWLGITRAAAVSRIRRLRSRLIDAAFRYGSALDRTERTEFARFLRRTGAVDEPRIAALQRVHNDDNSEDPER